MKLQRPLISLDLETTGTDIKNDRIVEIGLVTLRSGGSVESKRRLVNPGIKIPPEMTTIHGISDKDVENEPLFSKIAKSLAEILSNCDITGYNIIGYDVPLLTEEFKRCGIVWPTSCKIVDAMQIMNVQERRTLAWALSYYSKTELSNAHSAEADAQAAMTVLQCQADRYHAWTVEELLKLQSDPTWFDATGKFRYLPDKNIVCNFGKHSGQPLTQIQTDYLYWILNSEFSPEVKDLMKKEIDRRRQGQFQFAKE
jgi:DNA polymerase-3 subunit epsilon